jgi:membrane protease YdiL (CAAX protease family)
VKKIKSIKLWKAFVLFAGAGIIFYIIIRILVPYLSKVSCIHPLILWSVLGCFLLFLPLFLLSLLMLKQEGYAITLSTISQRFRLKTLTKKDIMWSALGIMCALIATGAVMCAWDHVAAYFSMNKLSEVTPFIQFDPLKGHELLILLVWLPMFCFNIIGEEFLWRGVLLPRQEVAYGKYAWLINAALHILVHICFGFPLIITVIPIVLVIPFVVTKTKNTFTGIIIHAVINGPAFILIALGVFTW